MTTDHSLETADHSQGIADQSPIDCGILPVIRSRPATIFGFKIVTFCHSQLICGAVRVICGIRADQPVYVTVLYYALEKLLSSSVTFMYATYIMCIHNCRSRTGEVVELSFRKWWTVFRKEALPPLQPTTGSRGERRRPHGGVRSGSPTASEFLGLVAKRKRKLKMAELNSAQNDSRRNSVPPLCALV